MTDMPEHVIPLQYSSTNTYLIRGRNGILLFDTGWAGTFREFCREMGEKEIPVQEISYVLISHFHPDHCGIAQEIADCGAQVAVMDVQREFVHAADDVLRRGQGYTFHPIDDSKTRLVRLEDSRRFLAESGIDGEILATPGHSDDSISLCLDGGCFFVGDLNPLYELGDAARPVSEDDLLRTREDRAAVGPADRTRERTACADGADKAGRRAGIISGKRAEDVSGKQNP